MPSWPVLGWPLPLLILLYFTFTLLYFTFTLFYFTLLLLYFTLLYFTLLYFTLLYFTLLYFTLLYFTVNNFILLIAVYKNKKGTIVASSWQQLLLEPATIEPVRTLFSLLLSVNIRLQLLHTIPPATVYNFSVWHTQ